MLKDFHHPDAIYKRRTVFMSLTVAYCAYHMCVIASWWIELISGGIGV
jgi:hypothetical protein